MLGFERRVVAALAAEAEPGRRAAIDDWVDGSLAAMPELLRAGVAAESVALGGWWRLAGAGRRRDLAGFVERLGRSRLGPLRQYARLFRSLVLFAELET